ncbi:MAG: Cna B-type domain-containing protein, partial [Erysipelotrichaceae bacterium]|nr:Cna B-type domain-containing protein [Erysipelotrichaceae bacterium]
KYTWTKLDKKSGGKDIEYTVTEEAVDKYTTEITGSQKDGYVVTNTHVPDTIDIPVEKIWEDNENNDKKRPGSVTVYLKADGETVKTVELNEGNEWKYTWTGMAKYNAGKEIVYTVEEKTVANYDAPIIEGSVEDGFKITNPREDDKTSVPVEKKWEGDANLGVRPESIEVALLADDEETGKTLTLNEGNNWKGTFEDLVVNKDGEKVIYTIKEVDVKPGYQSSVGGNAKDGFVITNKFTPKYVDPPVMKKVIGDSDGSGDKFTFQLKALKGAPMPDGVTGDTMTIEAGIGKSEFGFITIAKVGKYEYEISEVPDDGNENYKYDDTVYHLKFVVKEENGELVDEAFVDGESVGTFEDLDAAQFTFVNEYREYIDIDVEKVWKDESTGPDKRPDSIIVELMADGETIITVELSDENEWKHTFEHLEVSRKTEEGEYVPIEYTVNEVKVEGYETSISGSAEEGFVITNTRTVDTGDASQLDFWRNLYITSTVGSLLVAALYFKKEEEK